MVARWIADVSRLSRCQGASSTPSCMAREATPGSVGPSKFGVLVELSDELLPTECERFTIDRQNANHRPGLLPRRNWPRYTTLAEFAAHLCTGDSHTTWDCSNQGNRQTRGPDADDDTM